MLDDCAGDRFEELLAVFSTVVLRKVVLTEGSGEDGAVVRELATEDNISSEEQNLILPLVCAHRASLAALLRKRELLRSRYRDCSEVLQSKSESITRRHEQLNADTEGSTYDNDIGAIEAEALTRQVRESWLGEAGWAKLVIGGRSQEVHDNMLDSTFTDVFAKVKIGDRGRAEGRMSKGLLEDLESRVNDQQERLRRWGRFRDDLRKISCFPGEGRAAKDVGSSTTKGIGLVFGDHQHLLPGAIRTAGGESGKPMKVSIIDSPQLPTGTTYELLVERMQEELRNVSRPRVQRGQSWRKLRKDSALAIGYQDPSGINHARSTWNSSEQDSVNEVGEVENFHTVIKSEQGINTNKQDKQLRKGHVESVSSVDGEQEGVQPRMTTTGLDASSPFMPSFKDSIQSPDTITTIKTLRPDIPKAQPQKVRISTLDGGDPEVLAEAIISSVIEAASTPAKPKPSLLERTRMSMALSSSHTIPQTPMGPPLLPTPDTQATPKPLKGPMAIDRGLTLVERTRQSMSMSDPDSPTPDPEATPKPLKAMTAIDRSSTLVERTRQSMSMLPATSYRTRKSNYNLRFSRGYRVNQFETPRKQQPQKSDEKKTPSTPPPPEELFSEADYATVFKSRPKIALSPTVSLSLDSDPSLLLDGVIELAGGDGAWGSSPLTRVR